MSSGLIALLDEIAAIARSAVPSLDEIGASVDTAGMKAAGVFLGDAGITPPYVAGLSPAREVPIIAMFDEWLANAISAAPAALVVGALITGLVGRVKHALKPSPASE